MSGYRFIDKLQPATLPVRKTGAVTWDSDLQTWAIDWHIRINYGEDAARGKHTFGNTEYLNIDETFDTKTQQLVKGDDYTYFRAVMGQPNGTNNVITKSNDSNYSWSNGKIDGFQLKLNGVGESFIDINYRTRATDPKAAGTVFTSTADVAICEYNQPTTDEGSYRASVVGLAAALTKSGQLVTGSSNLLEYTIDVNQARKDLKSSSDTLSAWDVLPSNVSLKPGSIQLKQHNQDATYTATATVTDNHGGTLAVAHEVTDAQGNAVDGTPTFKNTYEPAEPSEPSKPDKQLPQTGDMLPSAGVFGGGALLAVALVGIGSWLRKRE